MEKSQKTAAEAGCTGKAGRKRSASTSSATDTTAATTDRGTPPSAERGDRGDREDQGSREGRGVRDVRGVQGVRGIRGFRGRIMVLVDPAYDYFRRIVEGVRAYRSGDRPWSITFGDTTILNKPGAIEGLEQVAGIIAAMGHEGQEQAVAQLGVPAVNVSSRLSPAEALHPRVSVDNEAVGRLGAEHLLERGFKRLAFCGIQAWFSQQRAAAFEAAAAAAGVPCEIERPGVSGLAGFLGGLATPVAVMASDDQRASHVLECLGRLELAVPEEVAVIGVNNEWHCHLATPTLSSVDPSAEQVGFEAARLLDRLLQGEAPPAEPVLVAPRGVVERASTQVLAIDDPEVRRAVEFIRDNACRGIGTEQVLDQTNVSRPTLTKRFRAALGCTVREEIRRVQFARARQLLIDTDLKVPEVADRCGFSSFTRFTDQFSKRFGEPPTTFRHRHRHR